MITTLRQHGYHAAAIWLPRNGNGEAEGLLGVWGDAKTIIGALAYKPDYALLGVGDYELSTLLKDILLAVGEIIAYELHAVHAERNKAVALLNVAQRERELDVRCVETYAVGCATRHVIVATIFRRHLYLQTVAEHIRAGFGYAH